jgi:orotidine-5'-phosphate decarboxylase
MTPNPIDLARNRLIVAVDVASRKHAQDLRDRLGDDVLWYKLGLELFTAEGPAVVDDFKRAGKRVFLDLKLHDIPNQVAGAVRSACRLGADLLTIHASGGPAMLRAAVEARNDIAPDGLRLLGVTVLTSLDGTEFPDVYRSMDVRSRVRAFADAACHAGVDGAVASTLELAVLREVTPHEFLKVIPGIRIAGGAAHDQARVATPAAALRAGATHLVVGRAITGAADPPRAAQMVLEEMASAL